MPDRGSGKADGGSGKADGGSGKADEGSSRRGGRGGDSLGREDWAEAALDAALWGGVKGIAVEAVARKLGVTKGSFYWHFANRDELLAAAVERWERTSTAEIIADLGGLETADVLPALVNRMLREPRHGKLEVVFASEAAHPAVAPVLRRVIAARTAFVAGVLRSLGLAEQAAQRRSKTAYALFLGYQQLIAIDPGHAPLASEREAFVAEWVQTMLARE